MTTTGFGDLAGVIARQQQITTIKRTIEDRSSETVTGRLADPAAALRGQLSPLVAIDASLGRLRGWSANIDETGRQLSAMQLVFETMETFSDLARKGLMSAASTENAGQIRVVVADARDKLEGVLSALNTRVGERSIFSGTATSTSPFQGGAEAVLDPLRAVIAGTQTAEEMVAAVDAWFDDPAGFQATLYRGGDTAVGPVPVAEGQTVSIAITGDHQAVRATIKAFAIAALADQGPGASSPDQMAQLADHAARELLVSAADRALAAGTLGLAEGQVEAARSRNAAESSSLEIARSDLRNADPFEAASALAEAQARLEMLFTTTARMSRLSLTNYL